MNPLIDNWLKVWDKLIGRRYRYRPDPTFQSLAIETRRFIGWLYVHRQFEYRHAAELVERGRLAPQFHYRHFKKRKSDGTFRHLAEPDPVLKKVQKNIERSFLRRAQVHRNALGYRRKKSIVDHVTAHIGANIIITADIRDFFPSTTQRRVRDWWSQQFELEETINLATLLTTYQGSLPQGAPTSPALSNIVNYEMDLRLTRRAERHGAIYTRYVDDMVFSWHGNDRPPADFRHGIEATLREFGYQLHPDKWSVYKAEDEPEITGLVLRKHGTVTITDEMQKTIRELEKKDPQGDRLAGYRGFQKMLEQHS